MVVIEFVRIPSCLHKLGLASGWDLENWSPETGKLLEAWLHVHGVHTEIGSESR